MQSHGPPRTINDTKAFLPDHCICNSSSNCRLIVCAVIEGMDVVMKVEAAGSGSGKPKSKVTIVDSGELTE